MLPHCSKPIGFLVSLSLLLQVGYSQEFAYSSTIQQLEDKLDDQKAQLETLKLDWIKDQLETYGLPSVRRGQEITWYDGFAVQYNATYKQARWVAHMILPEINNVCEERTDEFLEDLDVDPELKLELYVEDREKESERYDRGHLAPAADLRWSPRAVRESFYLTNMSPQRAELNQGLWAELEKMIRSYIRFYNDSPLLVVTGPVLKGGDRLPKLDHTGESDAKLAIPKTYFKAVVDLKRQRGIGFIMDQDAPAPTKAKEIRKELLKCMRTIKELQSATGLYLFTKMDNRIERKIEGQALPHLWMVNAPLDDFKLPKITPRDSDVLTSSTAKDALKELNREESRPVTILGRVTSSSRKDGQLRLNLDGGDEAFIQVDESLLKNFSMNPEKDLMRLVVECEGQLERYGGGWSLRACVVADEEGDFKIVSD